MVPLWIERSNINMLTYCYGTKNLTLKFNKLEDVGVAYQPLFEQMLRDKGWTTKTSSMNGWPGEADFVCKAKT